MLLQIVLSLKVSIQNSLRDGLSLVFEFFSSIESATSFSLEGEGIQG